MLGYINKISSLEEKASARVAIKLCQENGFKEVALNLEKPTYGCFISLSTSSVSVFISDPQKLSIWAKVKENNRLRDAFVISCSFNDKEMKARQWDTAVDEQCQRLMEGIPNQFKQTIHPWINHIALEYLSYSRRQEVLFGVSRYFLMNIFTREDWKETARLDEKKLAQRLLEDERLTVLQRYCIACVYCLHIHIFQLWERLTQKEKWFASKADKYHRLVLFWSRYMEKKVPWQKIDLQKAVTHAVNYGNYAALMMCWNAVSGNGLQMFVIDRALQSLRQYQSLGGFHGKEQLVSYQSPENQCDFIMKHFNLPSYYTELIFFFLSRMDEEEQLTFFKASFESKYCYQGEYDTKSVLECYLEWPHQDGFLLTINKLWGIIPKDKYVQCLLALAHKYSGDDTKANRFYDYRSLLRELWEETPEEYQQYVFHYKNPNYLERNAGVKLLSQLLERSPFQEEDEALFKRIFHDQPQEKRRAMMRSTEGEYMCLSLMRKEKWSFLNGLLVECLSKEGIPGFKKLFMQSTFSVKLALYALKENRGKVVEDLLDWSLESEAEKTQCKDELKYALINGKPCLYECEFLLRHGQFAEVEHMINFCLSSDEKKEQFKKRFAQCACGVLVRDFRIDQNWSKDYSTDPWSIGRVLEQMDTIIAWSVDTEEKIRDFKKDLFSRKRIDIRDRIVLPEEL